MTPSHVSSASVHSVLLQQDILKTQERKSVSNHKSKSSSHSTGTDSVGRSDAVKHPRHGRANKGHTHMTTVPLRHCVRGSVQWFQFRALTENSSGEETLDAKMAFEGFAQSMNVHVKHYHANNGRFCEKLWMTNVKKGGQTISFCGVNTHFQNGVAERQIRTSQMEQGPLCFMPRSNGAKQFLCTSGHTLSGTEMTSTTPPARSPRGCCLLNCFRT
jgi:hypothetical protein